MKRLLVATSLVAMTFCATSAQAVVDVVEAPTGFFVPNDSMKEDPTYWRIHNEDWSWTHGAIGTPFTTAALNISAYDVDLISGEIDNIYAWEDTASDWILLGNLAGSNEAWEFTSFDLGAIFFEEIAAGLQVRVDIDSAYAPGQTEWRLTLGKSTLTTDDSDPGDPTPGVPEPSTWAMMIGGLGLAGGLIRRRKTSVQFA